MRSDVTQILNAIDSGDPSSSEAIIVAHSATPYRLLIEVLFTLGQSEFGRYHLLVMKAGT